MSNEVPSRQEMFDRAWRGLKSQGWKRAVDHLGCVYSTPDGRRCAWGWVDPDGTSGALGSVRALYENRVGLAGLLRGEDVLFANWLQSVHDLAVDETLQQAMRSFAAKHGLSIPDEEA